MVVAAARRTIQLVSDSEGEGVTTVPAWFGDSKVVVILVQNERERTGKATNHIEAVLSHTDSTPKPTADRNYRTN